MAPPHREHNCIHEQLERPEPPHRTHQPYFVGASPPEKLESAGDGDGTAEADWVPDDGMAPIRIVINTDALRSDPGMSCFSAADEVQGQACAPSQLLTAAKVHLLENELMPRAVAFFSRLLRVTPVAGNLRLGLPRCGFSGGVQVSPDYASRGVPDADIVFFVTARPIGAQSGADTIAYSGHCEVDQFGRPVAAHFNWSPEHLDPPESGFESEYLLRVGRPPAQPVLVGDGALLYFGCRG